MNLFFVLPCLPRKTPSWQRSLLRLCDSFSSSCLFEPPFLRLPPSPKKLMFGPCCYTPFFFTPPSSPFFWLRLAPRFVGPSAQTVKLDPSDNPVLKNPPASSSRYCLPKCPYRSSQLFSLMFPPAFFNSSLVTAQPRVVFFPRAHECYAPPPHVRSSNHLSRAQIFFRGTLLFPLAKPPVLTHSFPHVPTFLPIPEFFPPPGSQATPP